MTRSDSLRHRSRFVALLILAVATNSSSSSGQSALSFSLKYGPHTVGYRSHEMYDRTRNIPKDTVAVTGEPVSRPRPRPIHVSVWYPARKRPGTRPMTYGDYLHLFARPLHFASSDDAGARTAEEEVARWPMLLVRNPGVRIPERREVLKASIARERNVPTHAFRNAPPNDGAYPIVIYTAGQDGPSFENDVLMEYLASHGYIVFGVPCWGEAGSFFLDTRSLEATSRDIEFVLAHARGLPGQASQRAALMGWSCGGMASVTVTSRNASVDAVVGLDASIRYLYSNDALRAMFAPPRPYSTPTLFLEQGNSLMRDLARAGADTVFTFFDSLRYADAYVVTLKNLRHQNFASMYVRLAGAQPFAFTADPVLASAGYETVAKYAVTFLDAYLKNDGAARTLLASRPHDLGLPDTNLAIVRKQARRPLPTMAGFTSALTERGWDRVAEVISRVKASDPDYTIDPDSLENAGIRFVESERLSEGVGLYRLYSLLHPADPRAWNGLGEAFEQRADTANAVASFREALRLRPENGRAANGLKRLAK